VRFQPGGGAIVIDAAAIGTSERASTAEDRPAAVKDKGVSTARRSAIFFVHTVFRGSPPQYDEGGFYLWGGPRLAACRSSRRTAHP